MTTPSPLSPHAAPPSRQSQVLRKISQKNTQVGTWRSRQWPTHDCRRAVSLTALAASALVGGAAGWLHGAFDRGDSQLLPPAVMIVSGALMLPVGLPMWFAGSSTPTAFTDVVEPREDAYGKGKTIDIMAHSHGPMVTRDPVMAATGAGLTALGGIGLVTMMGTSIAISNGDSGLRRSLVLPHGNTSKLALAAPACVGRSSRTSGHTTWPQLRPVCHFSKGL